MVSDLASEVVVASSVEGAVPRSAPSRTLLSETIGALPASDSRSRRSVVSKRCTTLVSSVRVVAVEPV